MSEHTPGPWRTYNMSKNKILKQWHIQRDDCKHDIALVSLDVAADERESVANLIAAAPAMYEALVKAMVLIDIAALEEENRAYRGEQQPITSEARDRQHLAQAALAQAEGSKP